MMIAKLNHVRKSGINTNLDLEKNIAKLIVCLSHLSPNYRNGVFSKPFNAMVPVLNRPISLI